MPSLPFLLAPLALLLPLALPGAQPAGAEDMVPVAEQVRDSNQGLSPLPLSQDAPAWSPLFDGVAPADAEQVRIQRRVILRISPAPARQNFTAEAAPAPVRQRIVERPAGNCVDSADIGGVADRGDRLVLFMRDRRTLAAKLEKGCSPRDFYRGFYMERSDDGKLCVRRDRLMSRSGAKCQVASFTQLVVERVD